MTTEPRKPLLVNLTWAALALLGLGVLYVMSYPVTMRFEPSVDIPVYRPVQWLIDETPLRSPIYVWSRACGTEDEIRFCAAYRLIGESFEGCRVR